MTEPHTQAAETHESARGGHPHPRYMLVWLWLLILTVLEVGVVMISTLPKSVVVIGLLAMAIVKALLVALYFMHLRFEPNRLRLVALAPLPAAILMVVVIMMEYV